MYEARRWKQIFCRNVFNAHQVNRALLSFAKLISQTRGYLPYVHAKHGDRAAIECVLPVVVQRQLDTALIPRVLFALRNLVSDL